MPGCQLITHILQFVVAALRRSFARNLNDRKVLEKSCPFHSEEHPLRLKKHFSLYLDAKNNILHS